MSASIIAPPSLPWSSLFARRKCWNRFGAAGDAKQVFFDIDCDVLDPSCFPAVSHPLPLGMSLHDLVRLLDVVWSDRLAGVAISEFDPARDQNDRCLSCLAWLLEYLLLRRDEPRD